MCESFVFRVCVCVYCVGEKQFRQLWSNPYKFISNYIINSIQFNNRRREHIFIYLSAIRTRQITIKIFSLTSFSNVDDSTVVVFRALIDNANSGQIVRSFCYCIYFVYDNIYRSRDRYFVTLVPRGVMEKRK